MRRQPSLSSSNSQLGIQEDQSGEIIPDTQPILPTSHLNSIGEFSRNRLQQQMVDFKKERVAQKVLQLRKSTIHEQIGQNLNTNKAAAAGTKQIMPRPLKKQGINQLLACQSHSCDLQSLEFQQNRNKNLAVSEALSNQARRDSVDMFAHQNQSDEEEKIKNCRICFQKDQNLISPCLCNGSLKFVHEDCLVQWLLSSNRKRCEICQTPFFFYQGIASLREILEKIKLHFGQDKSRMIRFLIYFVYLWFLKNRLLNLIQVYYKMVRQMKAMWMLKALYNLFIVTIVFQLATDQYERVKRIYQFLKDAIYKVKVRGIKDSRDLDHFIRDGNYRV